MEKCKKCLLYEAGESVTLDEINQYINTLDKALLVNEKDYQRRITNCINCDNLLSGMCTKCGCYVELRARLKNKRCADYDNIRW